MDIHWNKEKKNSSIQIYYYKKQVPAHTSVVFLVCDFCSGEMGQKISRNVVADYLNTVTSEAILSVNQECIVPVTALQFMRVKCDAYTTDAQGNSIHHEANEGCFTCVDGIRREIETRLLEIEPAAWEKGKKTIEDKAVIMNEIRSRMERCLPLCKQCVFSGNRQNVQIVSDDECIQDINVVNKVQNEITEKILQDMDNDQDIFSKVAAILPTMASNTTSVESFIRNEVSNKVTTSILNRVTADLRINQVMSIDASDSVTKRGDTQDSLLSRSIKTIQTANVHTDLVNRIDIESAQKLSNDQNTAKRVFATVGNTARQISDILTTGAGLIMMIVVIIAFVIGGVMLILFVTTGKNVSSIFNPETYKKKEEKPEDRIVSI